jgi:hypothetical protein
MRFLVKAGLALCVIALLVFGLRHAGPALVVNQPQRSDVILILAGDSNDLRFRRGLELMRAGYAGTMLVDARSDAVAFGRPVTELMEDFIRRSAIDPVVAVCRVTGDSTLLELRSAYDGCIQHAARHSVLLVTSDYHTRRALSIARKTFPQYTWSAAAANSGLLSNPHWWKTREIAKNVFLEWQKLLWWELVERHQ